MAANPIVLTIGAIAGLIAIGVILYKKFEPFREMINGIWEAFKNTFPSSR
ncbi:hypothetical protein KHA80_14450 [Anaerobacillus sp. HL2]|nr:hypothetical protein KHA80_14450 [Anaerobacillus sp. HL2]